MTFGSKRKGSAFERKIVKLFGQWGWKARRQPLSGALIDFPHDVVAETPQGRPLICELKKWKHGWRTGDTARGKADLLIVERNFGEPMVYLPLALFADLLAENPAEATPEEVKPAVSEKPVAKMRGKGFDKNLRKRMDGTVERVNG